MVKLELALDGFKHTEFKSDIFFGPVHFKSHVLVELSPLPNDLLWDGISAHEHLPL